MADHAASRVPHRVSSTGLREGSPRSGQTRRVDDAPWRRRGRRPAGLDHPGTAVRAGSPASSCAGASVAAGDWCCPSVVDVRRRRLTVTARSQLVAAGLEGASGPSSAVTAPACGTGWATAEATAGASPARAARRRAGTSDSLRSAAPAVPTRAPSAAVRIRIARAHEPWRTRRGTSTSVDEAASLVIEAVQRRLSSLPSYFTRSRRHRVGAARIPRAALRLADRCVVTFPRPTLLQPARPAASCRTRGRTRSWSSPTAGRLISPDAWFDDIGNGRHGALAGAPRCETQTGRGRLRQDGQLTEAGVLVLGLHAALHPPRARPGPAADRAHLPGTARVRAPSGPVSGWCPARTASRSEHLPDSMRHSKPG